LHLSATDPFVEQVARPAKGRGEISRQPTSVGLGRLGVCLVLAAIRRAFVQFDARRAEQLRGNFLLVRRLPRGKRSAGSSVDYPSRRLQERHEHMGVWNPTERAAVSQFLAQEPGVRFIRFSGCLQTKAASARVKPH
jgi:hypothetical protein